MIFSGDVLLVRIPIILLLILVDVVKRSVEQQQQQYQPYPPQYPPQYGQAYAPSGNYNPYSQQGPPCDGNRDYGDICQPKDPCQSCDVSRGLACFLGRCNCLTPGAIYRHGKCRAKVNRICENNDGSRMDCILNAECNSATRLCQCKWSYWSNDANTVCNNARKISGRSYWLLVPLLTPLLHRFL